MNEIPKKLRPKLCFLDNFVEPEGFRTWTTEQRVKWASHLRGVALSKLKTHQPVNLWLKEPTRTCTWLWLGAYVKSQKGRYVPRYSNKSVVPILFKALVYPMHPRSILVPFRHEGRAICEPCDVNPFKYMIGVKSEWGGYNRSIKDSMVSEFARPVAGTVKSDPRLRLALEQMTPKDENDKPLMSEFVEIPRDMVIDLLQQLVGLDKLACEKAYEEYVL